MQPRRGWKQPGWVVLDFEKRLRAGSAARFPKQYVVHGRNVVAYPSPKGGEVLVADAACPHRGADLGAGTVTGECVRCPYHGLEVGPAGHAASFWPVCVRDGLVWVDSGRGQHDEFAEPPAYPVELREPLWRTFEYSRDLDVNPVLLQENVLDHAHLGHVHAVTIPFSGDARVRLPGRVDPNRPETFATAGYGFSGENYTLEVLNSYSIPFTASLHFKMTVADAELPSLMLWFSISPIRRNRARLHLRVSRQFLKAPPLDALFRMVDALPLHEDAKVVAGIDPGEWGANRLDRNDAFLAMWREAMLDNFPALIDFYVGAGSSSSSSAAAQDP